MMHFSKQIVRSSAIVPSPRLIQVLGLFDVAPAASSGQSWDVDFTLPDPWNVGLIVGPSGSGKSTIARELFAGHFADDLHWPADRSILDAFPGEIGIKEITGLLSSVGFSSPPAWVRPFACLSTGQQFRVGLARTLAAAMVDRQLKVVDEYSSVVDRTVARVGSSAVARTVRRHGLQFVAVTCHYDVIDWLEPDWVYDVSTNELQTNSSREGVRRWRRPAIELEIVRSDRQAWQRFKPHHYLSGNLHPAAACYVGLVDRQPAAFTAVLPFPHPTRSGWREHRTVCLPDYQGVGIGNAMSEFTASIYQATGRLYYSTTSHPAMIYHRARSPQWRMTRRPGLTGGGPRFSIMRKTAAIDRLTAGFVYTGPARPTEARQFGLSVSQHHRQISEPGNDDANECVTGDLKCGGIHRGSDVQGGGFHDRRQRERRQQRAE